MKHVPKVLFIIIPLLWVGMIGGISFIEAPLKFQAPGITLALGLGIGKLVFSLMNKIEWIFCVTWLIATFLSKKHISDMTIPAVVLGTLALQTFWLLPILDHRAELIIAGEQNIKATSLHIYYVATEAMKIVLLLGASSLSLFHVVSSHSSITNNTLSQ